MFNLLSNINGNHKIEKTNKKYKKYLTTILHLKPHKLICPNATNGCRASCLNTSGFGCYSNTQKCRKNRTNLWLNNRNEFKKLLLLDLIKFYRICRKRKKIPAIRLNGTSDIAWEREFPELFSIFHDFVFYDYTKSPKRYSKQYKLPHNYHLLFSRSEKNYRSCINFLRQNKNICVIFPKKKLPKKLWGYPVFNGDVHDLIFLQPKGIIGVSAKGRARHDKSGFVYPII